MDLYGPMPGFSALLVMVPDQQIAVVYLANSDSQRLSNTVDTALKLLVPESNEKPVSNSSKPLEMTEAEMLRYSGKYSNR